MNEQLLIRFLTGSCTQEDLPEVEKWISEDQANADWLFEMERIWSLKNELHASGKDEIEAAYHRFRQAVSKVKETKPVIIRKKLSYGWLKYAAAILITALLSTNLYLMFQDRHDDIALNTVEVPIGQRASVTLKDGTKVWLNAGSILSYPSQFDKKERMVRLDGEGFFEVTPDKQKPFVVHTSLMDVQVLGTKFNMKAYNEEDVSVALLEGKVQVSVNDTQASLVLQPGEEVSYNKSGHLVHNKRADLSATTVWTTGEMLFADKPLKEIARVLERRFGVSITIDSLALADEPFTCRTQPEATIEQVLNLLKATKKLNYTINEQTVHIKASNQKGQ